MAETKQPEIRLEHQKPTDVMFVDFRELRPDSDVIVCQVGDQVGFPGQVLARRDRNTGEVYGLTIENFSGFRRTVLFRDHMASARAAAELMARSFIAACSMDVRHRMPRTA
jgi:hypothetical protein